MATVAAFSNEKPIHIVHLDAHFDFIDERNGISWGHSSPMRRASEMPHVKSITTLGPHQYGRGEPEGLGSRESLWHARRSLAQAPVPGRRRISRAHSRCERVYVSIDIDSLIRRSHRERPRSATAASPTMKARTFTRGRQAVRCRRRRFRRGFLRPTILPGSPRCSLHGPASTSSGPFFTSAPGGAPDADHGPSHPATTMIHTTP